jgi:undecaprenyldiphospho-muramoylpentapeptide beta-N-acetylglucosaminyltransferase
VQVWIAGGGTGGHVYPGLAVVQALAAEPERARKEVLYVGGAGGVEERLVTRAGLRFVGVPAGGVHGLAPWRALWNLIKLIQGWGAAYRLGRRQRPAVLFATGGYASVPVALAAWTLRVPILVYLPDIEPGLAVRVIARLAAQVAVTVEDSRSYFPAHKVIVTGYPVRAELHGLDRAGARRSLGLDPAESVLLVLGGSRGARSINQALSGVLEQVLGLAQVVHVSGELDWPSVAARLEALPMALKPRYHAFPYLHEEVGSALVAADLALCRAGASTLGELPFFGLPAVLVPYPHAWRYQRVNADWLVGRGAAVRLNDERLADELLPMLRRLLDDRASLTDMAERMRALARPDAATRLAAQLQALAGR